jgi:hypothetical protein
MDRKPYPSEEANRFQIRMPNGMRETICKDAARNGRSMNSEIVSRLGSSSSASNTLTLRDYFAGQALVGMMQAMRPYSNEYERSAKAAYEQADAMLAQRDALIAELAKGGDA